MKYFSNCKSIDEVKKTFRELCKVHHPDKGGDLATMQAINSEYQFAIAKIAKGENLSQDETEAAILDAEAYREALAKVAGLPGIDLELVGTWVWASGNTYPVRSHLKDAGFLFSHNRKMWYFRTGEYKFHKSTGKMKDMDTIRAEYGSQRINPVGFRAIA